MKRVAGCLWLISALATLGALSACVDTRDGRPVADSATAVTTPTSETLPDPASASTTQPPSGPSTMGVAPTLRDRVPPNALLCLPEPTPGAATPVQIADPAAPRIVVSLPTGWTSAPAPTGLILTGPDGMSGAVGIAETELDAGAAFQKYADAITASAPISSVSILPAESCGYSGQRLMGVLSGGGRGNETYEDRIVHVWTNTTSYLVTIHVTAPGGSPAFDAAAGVLTADFAITIP